LRRRRSPQRQTEGSWRGNFAPSGRDGVVDAATVAAQLDLAAQNAQRAITPLADAGVLTEFTGFKRNRRWQASEVLTGLDEFAARAGSRVR
jgi:Fic family protein